MHAPTAPGILASVPSPSDGIVHVGPLPLHAYGLCIAVGILVAVRVSERRWERRGHSRSDIADIAIWVVIAGLLGARLYHVLTDYELYTHDPLKAFAVWDGGLGIWGAVAGGAIAAIVLARRRHLDTLALLDALAPGVVLAQAIGRWGNYFNQELFGRPSGLPWAIRIDPAHRPAIYRTFATFQPTFLYESLWCLAIPVGPRDRRRRARRVAQLLNRLGAERPPPSGRASRGLIPWGVCVDARNVPPATVPPIPGAASMSSKCSETCRRPSVANAPVTASESRPGVRSARGSVPARQRRGADR